MASSEYIDKKSAAWSKIWTASWVKVMQIGREEAAKSTHDKNHKNKQKKFVCFEFHLKTSQVHHKLWVAAWRDAAHKN